MSARGEEFGSQIQGSAVWLKNNVELFFQAKPALVRDRVKIWRSVDHTPLYFKIFVFVLQVPYM